MNLRKKDIGNMSAMQLCGRVSRLHFDEEAGCAFPGDKEEIALIEKALREKLVKMLGHDFYPPELKEPKPKLKSKVAIRLTKEFKEKFGNMKSKPKPEPEAESGLKLNFKITITSSVGSKAAEKIVKVDSKGKAEAEAQAMIEQLGLKGATYKIS